MGLFNTAAVRPILFLPPTSSRIHLQRRHATCRCARPLPNYYQMNFASKSVIDENSLGSFTCRKAGTWERFFYFPSGGGEVKKIQRLRPVLNPQTWVPEASMLTTRPPKPSTFTQRFKPLLKNENEGDYKLFVVGRRDGVFGTATHFSMFRDSNTGKV